MNVSITTFLLPLALALIMFYLGLTLRVADFRRVFQRPRAIIVGLVGQLAMVPLLGVLIAWSTGLDPVMAVGFMVVAACPGGVSSGLFTRLAHGDVALSISLTAVTSVIAMFSLPLVVDASMRLFMGTGLSVEFPMGGMVRKIFLLTTLPVLAGIALRAWKTRWIERIEPLAARTATMLFALIVLSTFWDQRQVLIRHFGSIGPASFLLNLIVLTGAWLLGQQARLSRSDRISIVTECGLHNSAVGIYVCMELLGSPAMSVPSVVYALMMNFGTLAFVFLMRTNSAKHGLTTFRASP